MMDRLQQPISTTELAREMGLSVRTLNRRFRQATGMTPLQYLTEQRIDEARQLLLHTNLAITEIALRVGLRDASNFARIFRQSTGVSPRNYRHAVRGKAFTP
jgi:transcriptional regulator GlxA family with amidase domain